MLRRTFMVLPIILGWLLSAATPSYCANSIVAEGGGNDERHLSWDAQA